MPAFKGVTLPAARRTRPGWLAASILAHALLVAFLLKAYSGFRETRQQRRETVVTIVPLPAEAAPEASAPPARQARPVRPPSPISAVPAAVPVAAAPVEQGGDTVAPVSGGGRRGLAAISPLLADRRLYSARPLYIPEGGGRPIAMDDAVRGRLLAMADEIDSLNAADSFGYRRRPYATPSWVVERDGKKWGIDQTRIHLGTFSIPTAILALLPFPQGNIDQARANARIADMRAEILRAAARSEAEDDFRRAVAQIRERRERERAEQRERERQQRQRDERPIN